MLKIYRVAHSCFAWAASVAEQPGKQPGKRMNRTDNKKTVVRLPSFIKNSHSACAAFALCDKSF